MTGTLEMMKQVLNGKEKNLSEIELISLYQKTLSSNLLAYMFVNNYGIITTISKPFVIINDQDKASFCLQELDKALRTFDNNKKVKFTTYFIDLYKARLIQENHSLQYDKRKIMNDVTELDSIVETSYKIDDYFADENNLLDNYNLTEDEKKHCRLLNRGYSIKELSRIFNKSLALIYQRNNKIKKKINLSLV